MAELGTRGRSQILRTYLPMQTADLRGRIYRVKGWDHPIPLHIDQEVVRRRLLRDLAPFESTGTDNGVAADLRRGARVEVVELDTGRGVTVERWPQVWLCSRCRRIGRSAEKKCRCGDGSWDQLHFVGFHTCGAIVEPFIRRCPQHDDTALRAPKSTKTADIRFVCPECHTETQRGLQFNRACTCGGGTITWNVHRARTVFTPHGTVLVNPPRPDQMQTLLDAGGRRRALDWVLDDMTTSRADRSDFVTAAGLTRQLIDQGLPPDLVEQMVALAQQSGQIAADTDTTADILAVDVRLDAEDEAVDIAMATWHERTTTRDLLATSDPVLRAHYEHSYPAALDRAGLAGLDLVEQFPVLNVMYGFSRGGQPGVSRLVPFRNPLTGAYRLHGELARTEAFFLQLHPDRVRSWLTDLRYPIDADLRPRLAILDAAAEPSPATTRTVNAEVYTLVHSYAHRLIRLLAVRAGIDRDALAEYLVPHHLGFFVYAAARGDFVLGGLQALFESDLDGLLTAMVDAEHRCPLDPGCSRGAGACSGCLHLGETSCRGFNTNLDRGSLFGPQGYLSVH